MNKAWGLVFGQLRIITCTTSGWDRGWLMHEKPFHCLQKKASSCICTLNISGYTRIQWKRVKEVKRTKEECNEVEAWREECNGSEIEWKRQWNWSAVEVKVTDRVGLPFVYTYHTCTHMHTNTHAHTHTCHTHIQSVQLLRSVTDLGLVLAVFKLFTLLGKYVRISPVAETQKLYG